MKLALGYPDRDYEMAMLDVHGVQTPLESLAPVCTCADIVAAQNACKTVTVTEPVKDYILRIVDATRNNNRISMGVSPRGTLALLNAARIAAAVDGRDYCIPDDVRRVAVPVLAHRIIARTQSTVRMSDTNEKLIEFVLDSVEAPIGR
jgi:MoxR-like ATPase